LEQVEVPTVEQRYGDLRIALEAPGRVQATEAATDDEDPVSGSFWAGERHALVRRPVGRRQGRGWCPRLRRAVVGRRRADPGRRGSVRAVGRNGVDGAAR
jgi:hypothetical protein